MGTHFRKRGERGKRRPSGTWTRPLLRSEEQVLDLLGVLAFLSKEEEEEERLLSPGMGGWWTVGLGLSCLPPCLPYGCGYLRRISILKPSFVLDIEKGIVRPKKDLDKILTVSIQISV